MLLVLNDLNVWTQHAAHFTLLLLLLLLENLIEGFHILRLN